MSYRRTSEDLLYPGRVLHQMIDDYIEGRLTLNTVFYRARVEEVGKVEGELESIPPSPAGSVRARVYTYGLDATTPGDALTIFYPLFSNGEGPTVEPGEHVYVFFEDSENKSSGIWVSKIPNYTDINNADPDVGTEPATQNSAQKFEGTSSTPVNLPASARYGGVSTVNKNNKRVTDAFEKQSSTFWSSRRVLLVGDSTVETVYGTILGDVLRSRGASFYFKDGRVSWGVRHWNSGIFTGRESRTNKKQGQKLSALIRSHNPDLVIINLGGNDWGISSRSDYPNQIRSLLSELNGTDFFWTGPPQVFAGRLISSQRLPKVRRGRQKAIDVIKDVVGEDKFIDATRIRDNPAARRDGVHFSSDPQGRSSAKELANLVADFPK